MYPEQTFCANTILVRPLLYIIFANIYIKCFECDDLYMRIIQFVYRDSDVSRSAQMCNAVICFMIDERAEKIFSKSVFKYIRKNHKNYSNSRKIKLNKTCTFKICQSSNIAIIICLFELRHK